MTPDLLRWCEARQGWLLDAVAALVRLESPSTDKGAVDRCGAELSARLAALGGVVTRTGGGQRGDHIRADFDDRGASVRVLLLGHFDTVWPVGQLERMPFKEDGGAGRLHGPGVFDMKSGIAVAMLAMRALREHDVPRPNVTMLWTADEEIGSESSRGLVERTARECQAVLVLEPSLPGGAAKTSRKGCGEFEIVARGIAAHAGLNPESGASAIHELARQIIAVQALQDPSRGITLNVGTIEGGSRTNVVADTARATIDVRVPAMADAASIEAKLRALQPDDPRVRLEVTGAIGRPPLERSAAVVQLFELARSVATGLGRDLGEGAAGGGSDGNFTAAIGVPTLDGLGPRGDGAHALHEYVETRDLPWRAAFLAGLLSRIGGLH
ncbi:MAG TPA: M20 family metallopeptidase [Vicinamibacterales bacterium]|nr:M20 family metallopeptidase [Vicinamibacterales bacterium]